MHRDTGPRSPRRRPVRGPVPMVTHVHGAVGVGDESDGYAEAWYLPAANDIPADYASVGTWYDFFAGKATAGYGATWVPGYATFEYPNDNRASTIWYHDDTLGMTRVNVYAGPAGFYLIRGGPAGDGAVLDSRFGTPACFPDRHRKRATTSRPTRPTTNTRSRSRTAPSMPTARSSTQIRGRSSTGSSATTCPPVSIHPLEPGVLRQLDHRERCHLAAPECRAAPLSLPPPNGCQARFLILDFANIPGVDVGGRDRQRGRLPPRAREPHGRQRVTPADGSGRACRRHRRLHQRDDGNYVLGNLGPDEPFGGGIPRGSTSPPRSVQHRADHGVPRPSGRRGRPHHAAAVPHAAGDRVPAG